jgi:hypothetical protein
MVSTDSQLSCDKYTITELQLKQWQPDPYQLREPAYNTNPTTPSEYFSKMFPEQAKRYGCPYLEHVQDIGDGLKSINPIALNTDFFAAILGGDRKLHHKVVYVGSESAWYFYDCRDRIYKQTSDEKLGNLLKALVLRCAEELPGNVHKVNLFLEFRSDKTIRGIVHRAKSILGADSGYFGLDSTNERENGPELYDRVARQFVEQVLERQAGEVLTLNDAYMHFLEYLKRKEMPPVNRKVFKSLVLPVVKEEYELGVRNDLQDETGNKWQRGWKGLGILEPAVVLQES